MTAPPRLDLSQPQNVSYCIPLFLRDEQIKLNCQNVAGRLSSSQQRERTDPIAIVCYGPSLNDTWEEIRRFRYVMTTSGAHRFLIERGIVPTWHVDVDPRPHKASLIGAPHQDVEYLLASTCHPTYFAKLAGFNVKLWHVFDTKEEGFRALPFGEWALFGGSDAGHRAMVVSRFLGFKDLHIFGMDGCEGVTGKHAGEHPNQPIGCAEVEYPAGSGRIYRTTPAMAECVRQLPHEVDQLDDVAVTMYGEGLAQALMRDYQPTKQPKGTLAVGLVKEPLISPAYAALNAQLHRENVLYGIGGHKYGEVVQRLVEQLRPAPRSVLDYGCGKGLLAKALPFPIWEYDPGVPGKEESPRPADLVVCTDVLEHVEPERLKLVLKDLQRCVLRVGFFVIATGPASKTLPDGRNTHLIQKGELWWRHKLELFFEVQKIWKKDNGAHLQVIVGPKPKRAKESR